MHDKSHLQERKKWVVRENTHEPIIFIEQWERVQRLLEVKAKKVDFVSEDSLKGFIKCDKCGRSMVIRGKDEKAKYSCGSYERYGPAACPNNKIKRDGITRIILDDLNAMLSRIVNVRELNVPESVSKGVRITEKERLEKALERMSGLRRGVYEDYKAVSFPRRIT